ncbi:hypothetical protein U1Q18_012323 [Sarracenia purpurea var. burkii]
MPQMVEMSEGTSTPERLEQSGEAALASFQMQATKELSRTAHTTCCPHTCYKGYIPGPSSKFKKATALGCCHGRPLAGKPTAQKIWRAAS